MDDLITLPDEYYPQLAGSRGSPIWNEFRVVNKKANNKYNIDVEIHTRCPHFSSSMNV